MKDTRYRGIFCQNGVAIQTGLHRTFFLLPSFAPFISCYFFVRELRKYPNSSRILSFSPCFRLHLRLPFLLAQSPQRAHNLPPKSAGLLLFSHSSRNAALVFHSLLSSFIHSSASEIPQKSHQNLIFHSLYFRM